MILYLYWVIFAVIALFVFSGIRIVRPTQRALIERLGNYKGVKQPGFHWIIPIIDRMIKVNITERVMDVDPQDIITKDNLNAEVDLMVYYQVKEDEANLKRSRYGVDDFRYQIVSLAQTTARNVIGDMVFKDVNSKRNELNKQLAKVLDQQSDAWGVRVVRVELKEIRPPKDVQESMNRVIKAENLKDAAKDEAEAAETKADGERRAEIKKAQGVKQSSILVAEGQAKAFELIEKKFGDKAQLLEKLKTIEKTFHKLDKIVIPEGKSLVNVLGNLAGAPTK